MLNNNRQTAITNTTTSNPIHMAQDEVKSEVGCGAGGGWEPGWVRGPGGGTGWARTAGADIRKIKRGCEMVRNRIIAFQMEQG